VKADLYTAPAQTRGDAGLAHRTAAGFVVLTSADGDDIISLIDERQNETDLIDQIVASVHSDGPESFSMLFTAGGDLYLIAAGAIAVSIESTSSLATLVPVAGQVLVQAIHTAVNETAATITVVAGGDVADAPPSELLSGTTQASELSIAVGGALLDPVAAVAAQESDPTSPTEPTPTEPAQDAAAEPTPTEPTPVEPAQDAAAEPTPLVAAAAAGTAAASPDASEADATSEPAASPVPPPSEEAAPAAAPASEAAPPAESEPAATQTPLETVETPEEGAPVGPVMVLGVACPQGHHNHPDAVYCSQCGTKMGVHHTTVLLNGPRPPLGVLVVDDGTTYSLSEDLVIGREPTSHKEVTAGRAQPMILTDDTLSLSRKHAHIWLDDWSVFAQDLGSSNGTYLSRPGQNEPWFKLDPSSSIALEPGDRLRVGGRIIQVELHHVR